MLLGIGNIVNNSDQLVFECVDEWYLLYLEPPAAWFTLFHGLFFLLFSVLIWYIFYRLPYNYGLITKQNAKSLRMTHTYKSHVSNNLKESEIMEEFMKVSQQSEYAPVSPLTRKTSLIDLHTHQKSMASPKLMSPRAYTMINGRTTNNTNT